MQQTKDGAVELHVYYHRNTPEPPRAMEGEASPVESEPGMQCAEMDFRSEYTDPSPDERRDVSIILTLVAYNATAPLAVYSKCMKPRNKSVMYLCMYMQSYLRWSSMKSHKSEHLSRSDSEGELNNTATGIHSSFNDYQFN